MPVEKSHAFRQLFLVNVQVGSNDIFPHGFRVFDNRRPPFEQRWLNDVIRTVHQAKLVTSWDEPEEFDLIRNAPLPDQPFQECAVIRNPVIIFVSGENNTYPYSAILEDGNGPDDGDMILVNPYLVCAHDIGADQPVSLLYRIEVRVDILIEACKAHNLHALAFSGIEFFNVTLHVFAADDQAGRLEPLAVMAATLLDLLTGKEVVQVKFLEIGNPGDRARFLSRGRMRKENIKRQGATFCLILGIGDPADFRIAGLLNESHGFCIFTDQEYIRLLCIRKKTHGGDEVANIIASPNPVIVKLEMDGDLKQAGIPQSVFRDSSGIMFFLNQSA